MAIIVSSSFTAPDGTNQRDYVGEVGSTWVVHLPSSISDCFIHSNRLTKDSHASQSINYASGIVSGDAYVEAPIRMLSSISVNAGIIISLDPNSDNYVYARHNRDNGEYSIRSVVSGTATLKGDTFTETLVAGDVRTMRLEKQANFYRLLVQGIERIPPVEITGHTGTRVGTRMSGSASPTTGYAIESFEAGTLTQSLGSISRPQFLLD